MDNAILIHFRRDLLHAMRDILRRELAQKEDADKRALLKDIERVLFDQPDL
jgi:hypothetical protein